MRVRFELRWAFKVLSTALLGAASAVCFACNGAFVFDEADASVAVAPPLEAAAEDRKDSPAEDLGVACGATRCAPGATFCCGERTGLHCEAVGTHCAGLAIVCDDSSRCPSGRVCCAEYSNSHIMAVECHLAGTCPGLILCDPLGPHCPGDGECNPVSFPNLPPGFSACE